MNRRNVMKVKQSFILLHLPTAVRHFVSGFWFKDLLRWRNIFIIYRKKKKRFFLARPLPSWRSGQQKPATAKFVPHLCTTAGRPGSCERDMRLCRRHSAGENPVAGKPPLASGSDGSLRRAARHRTGRTDDSLRTENRTFSTPLNLNKTCFVSVF